VCVCVGAVLSCKLGSALCITVVVVDVINLTSGLWPFIFKKKRTGAAPAHRMSIMLMKPVHRSDVLELARL
jgi:hypothetical protein